MTKAFENAAKLRAWADPVALGADPTGTVPADSAFAAAMATGLPIHVPSGTFLLADAITAALAIGQDFVMTGEGPEVSRLVFADTAANGISVTYSTNGSGQAQGDKSAVRISGMDIETKRAGGGSAVRVINTPPSGQVNETQVAVDIADLRTNGADPASYWDIHQELENVTYPNLQNLVQQDAASRGVGLSLNCTGGYSAVEFAIENVRANEVGTALRVRGRCEGVYAAHFVAVGGTTGIDWVATLPVGGGKRPLLSLTASHINVTDTAVYAKDVSQIIGSDSLIYVTNSASAATFGFNFDSTNGLSSENHQLRGITIIGIGASAGAQSTGVRLGPNVFGCSIDARIEGVSVGVENNGQRNVIAPSALITNCTQRCTGFGGMGYYGEVGNVLGSDSTLQMEFLGGTGYSRDVFREKLRVESFIFDADASEQTVTRTLERPFPGDTAMLVACWGSRPSEGSLLYPDLDSSTKETLQFDCLGLQPGQTYRINYIAYGY